MIVVVTLKNADGVQNTYLRGTIFFWVQKAQMGYCTPKWGTAGNPVRTSTCRWSRNPSTDIKRIPQNKQKTIVCGGISTKSFVGYHSFKTIMNGSYYVQILQDHLIPNAGRRLWRLQQDNDPKQKSRLAQQVFASEVAEVIDRPSNGSDPSPVENFWSIIIHRVEKRKSKN